MSDEKIVYVGKKPLHAYVKAVQTAHEEGENSVTIVARGASIGRAVDVAEVCRRRNGIIASTLPSQFPYQTQRLVQKKCQEMMA